MTVLVTGAGGAIGRACVETFARNDSAELVVAVDLAGDRIPRRPNVVMIEGDLLADGLAAQLPMEVWRGVRAVVAAHGAAGAGALETLNAAYVRRVLEVNYLTIPHLYRSLQPALQRQPAAFVAVASQAALVGEADNIAYCAAKFALLGWVKEVNRRGDPNVRAFGLCPGATNSELLIKAQEGFAAAAGVPFEAYHKQRVEQISRGRYGEPEEIAAAALYLADRSQVRPEVLAVTGGDTLH